MLPSLGLLPVFILLAFDRDLHMTLVLTVKYDDTYYYYYYYYYYHHHHHLLYAGYFYLYS